MKITIIISSILTLQVSASFLDVFQGAVHSVQNSFGKLISDVVTDVKETVDCTILAIEHVLSLSADATALYTEKCRIGNNSVVNTIQQKEYNAPTVEISLVSNKDYLNRLLPEEIDARINDTMIKMFGYNPHDKLSDVEKELAKETERLANISNLVKQELDKLSEEIHINLSRQEHTEYKPSIDIILQQLRLLEAVENNIRNSSEANEIHKIVENVLRKLGAIEASEVTENAKVDEILKDLENNSNGTYNDLRKRLEDWKKDENRHLNEIKQKLEEHEKSPEHIRYLNVSKLNNTMSSKPNDIVSKTTSTPIEKRLSLTHTEQPKTVTKNGIAVNDTSDLTILNAVPLYVSTINLRNVTVSSVTPVNNFNALSTVVSNPIHLSTLSSINTVKSAYKNRIKQSITIDPGILLDPPLNHTQLLADTRINTATHISPMAALTTIMKALSTTPSLFHKTSTIYNIDNTKLNNTNNSVNTTTNVIEITTKSKIIMFPTLDNKKSAKLTADQIATPKSTRQQYFTNTEQRNDVSETTTPVAITTSSYVNQNNHTNFFDEIILTTKSPATVANRLIPQSDDILNTTLITTVPLPQQITVDIDQTSTPVITTQILNYDPIAYAFYMNESKSQEVGTTTEIANTNSYSVIGTYSKFPPNRKPSSLSNQRTITTPSLDAFLNYVDRIMKSTTTPPLTTIIGKKNSTEPASKNPWLTLSQNELSSSSAYDVNNNNIAPTHNKFKTSYNNPKLPMISLAPSLTGHMHSKMPIYNEPYIRKENSTNKAKLPYNNYESSPFLKILSSSPRSIVPFNMHKQSTKPYNLPFPYDKNNVDTPMSNGEIHRWPVLTPAQKRYNKNRLSLHSYIDNNRPPYVLTENQRMYKTTTPRRDNFDDPDYDSFFHIPPNNNEAHNRALREARHLIEDSQRAHRVMQNILKNKKGINAFNLTKSLNFGK